MRTAQDQIKQEKSDQRWNDIPRGTMDEVSSYFRLNLPSLTARPLNRLFHLVFESHHGRALGPSPKRSATARGQGIGLGEVLKHIAEKEPALAPFRIVVKKQGRFQRLAQIIGALAQLVGQTTALLWVVTKRRARTGADTEPLR